MFLPWFCILKAEPLLSVLSNFPNAEAWVIISRRWKKFISSDGQFSICPIYYQENTQIFCRVWHQILNMNVTGVSGECFADLTEKKETFSKWHLRHLHASDNIKEHCTLGTGCSRKMYNSFVFIDFDLI